MPALLIAGLAHAVLLGWIFSTKEPFNTASNAVQVELQGPPNPADAHTPAPAPEPDVATPPAVKPSQQSPLAAEKRQETTPPATPTQSEANTSVTPSVPAPPAHQPAADLLTSPEVVHAPATTPHAPDPMPVPPAIPEPALVSAQALSGRTPHYPALAIRRQQEGEVRVHLWLNPDGSVSHHEITQSSGHRLLDQAVIEFLVSEKFSVAAHSRGLTEQIFQFRFQLN